MRLKDIITAEKQNIRTGEWKTGRIPRTVFLLSKARGKAYRQGPAVKWRVIKFDTLGSSFRVLMRLQEGKEQFDAKLGLEVGNDLALLCTYEFHGTEPGWHCHLTCDLSDTIPKGIHRGPWIMRIPRGRSFHRRQTFGISETNALTKVVEFYKIHERRGLL